MAKVAEYGPSAFHDHEGTPVGIGMILLGAPWPCRIAARGEGMQNQPSSPESSGFKRQSSLAPKNC